jgi:hypothetical protein
MASVRVRDFILASGRKISTASRRSSAAFKGRGTTSNRLALTLT